MSAAVVVFSLATRARGAIWRTFAAAAILVTLANPSVVIEDARAAGLQLLATEDSLPFQFMLVFGR